MSILLLYTTPFSSIKQEYLPASDNVSWERVRVDTVSPEIRESFFIHVYVTAWSTFWQLQERM